MGSEHPRTTLLFSPILHGHTHHAFDYMLGNTRVVCNPRGYAGHEPIAEGYTFKYLDI